MCLAPSINTGTPPPPPAAPAEVATAPTSGLAIRKKDRKATGATAPSLTIPRTSLNLPT